MAIPVVLGMSGGVDSSVAASILQEQGYRVIGLFMKNWEDDGICQAAKDYEDVARVCDRLGIDYYSVSFAAEYWEEVFKVFLQGLQSGMTPNPDILCNKHIKFDLMLKKAKALGGAFLATGHYCQTDGSRLLRAVDTAKDQSYFLACIGKGVLADVLFPVGHMEKKDVRAKALALGLSTAQKKDSTGICFIGERRFRTFLKEHLHLQKGYIRMYPDGDIVGEHGGIALYTIGQRQGLGLGGEGEPWFVVAKDAAKNELLVVRGEHPALLRPCLWVESFSWIGDAPCMPASLTAKIRYRQSDQVCTVHEEGAGYRVDFQVPQRAVTPGQIIVLYDGPVCLGGGEILIAPVSGAQGKSS